MSFLTTDSYSKAEIDGTGAIIYVPRRNGNNSNAFPW